MNILGIDHGAKTGYAYLVNGKFALADSFDVIGKTDQDKFIDFYRKVEKTISRHKSDLIAVEKPMSFKNAFTSRTLIGYYTITVLVAGLKKIPVIEIIPTSMKKIVAGNGRATKEEVSIALLKRFNNLKKEDILEIEYYVRKKGIKNINYDKSDALGLATHAFISQTQNT